MKKIVALMGLALMIAACSDADVVSHNVSKAADNFEIDRRVVFFNGITDTYLLNIEGRCSIHSDNTDKQLEVTCKTGPSEYKKHYLGLSDNVTYFVEQLQEAEASEYHYRVFFRPESIVPDIDFESSITDDPES